MHAYTVFLVDCLSITLPTQMVDATEGKVAQVVTQECNPS